jgi:type I restriction enzyme M protein
LREEYWSALYGLGTRFGVSALDADDARRLVIEPVKGKLTFSPEAVERAVSITACQPYLLQCLCNRIFDFAAQTKARSVTLDTVEEASAALVKDNEHFASLWDYAGLYRRRLILMLCSQRTGPSEQVSFGELHELLTQRGIELSDEQLDADLAHLRELELIDLVLQVVWARDRLLRDFDNDVAGVEPLLGSGRVLINAGDHHALDLIFDLVALPQAIRQA